MPMPEGDATALMHPALVTHLTGSKPYYMKGGLIPHLTKKGCFWKSTPPVVHMTVLKYRLHIDPVKSAHLNQVDKIERGWTAPLPIGCIITMQLRILVSTSHLVLIERSRMCSIG